MPYTNAGAVFPDPFTAGLDVPGTASSVPPVAHDVPAVLLQTVGGPLTVALAAAAVLVIARRWTVPAVSRRGATA